MAKTPRNIEAIIEEQVRRWELANHERRAQARPRVTITVSREFGARGAALGAAVADRLGWKLWDRELLHEIAHRAEASDALFESLDEHRRDAVRETLSVLGFGRHVTADDYLRALVRVVRTIGEHGDAVIVGRGAQYILDGERTLRIRAIAPLEVRITGLAERRGISADAAKAEIAKVDADRQGFMRESFSRDPSVASDHDLLINTSRFEIAQAAELVIAALETRFPGARR